MGRGRQNRLWGLPLCMLLRSEFEKWVEGESRERKEMSWTGWETMRRSSTCENCGGRAAQYS